VWNVPHRRNPNFAGREELLAKLREVLTSGKPAALTQAIAGLGGVGKTQLALEYVWQHASHYNIVWWVRSEEPATLSADYASLAAELGLPEAGASDQRAKVTAVCRVLSRRSDWLLIFDNATDPDAIRDYLPQSEGHTLITSRNPHWSGEAQVLSVPVWSLTEASAFLLQRRPAETKAGARALADMLGRLPLALEHAAAYCEQTGRGYEGYLTLYEKEQVRLFAAVRPPANYRDTVTTTWALALAEVQRVAFAAEVLNLCAFLAPDEIPRDLVREELNAGGLVFDIAVGALRGYSLVEASEASLSVHRLVQTVVREALPLALRSTWAERAVERINRAFPTSFLDDPDIWSRCTLLLPHAQASTAQAELLNVAGEATGDLMNAAGAYLIIHANFVEARATFERALRIHKAVYGADHPQIASINSNLGSVLRSLGNLSGAQAAHERALRIAEGVYGLDHHNVATIANNLGGVLQDLGDLSGARLAFERALQIDERLYGPDHPEVAKRVNNLGVILKVQGDLSGARLAFERALQIGERVYGPDHPYVAIRINNLGSVLQVQGDLAGAQVAFERSLRIDEAVYGPDHPTVARDVNNLGNVLHALGDVPGALAAFDRALRICVRFLGEEHPTTKLIKGNTIKII
jgi:tetratricopeptide (TPR) repeat protein